MATTDPNAWGSSGGPFDPNAWANGWHQLTTQTPQQDLNSIGNVLTDPNNTPANILGITLSSLLGITPARAGKAMHQMLVGLAGVLIIILGFVMVISGSKTGQSLAAGAKNVLTKTAEVATIA